MTAHCKFQGKASTARSGCLPEHVLTDNGRLGNLTLLSLLVPMSEWIKARWDRFSGTFCPLDARHPDCYMLSQLCVCLSFILLYPWVKVQLADWHRPVCHKWCPDRVSVKENWASTFKWEGYFAIVHYYPQYVYMCIIYALLCTIME